MNLEQAKDVLRNGRDSAFWDAACQWLEAGLSKIPAGCKERAKDVLPRLTKVEGADAERQKDLQSRLMTKLRASGDFDDCWSRSADRKWMGHPLILWHAPKEK